MKLGYELTIEQTQKLSMTPELIQAIQILQFNNQELSDYVQNELLENPVLEAEKSYEQYVYEEDTLTDYLMSQLQFSRLTGQMAAIGRYIIEVIDDNGYLTMSVEEISKAVGADIDTVEEVLNFVQTFDPCGVAARNLRECLIIQFAAKGLLTDEIEYIIENMLEELAENKIAYIAKTIGIKNQEVQQIADLIKTMEPKPGRVFSSGEATGYVVPDIIVEKVNDEYQVMNNDTSMPKLMVSSYYNRLSAEAKKDEELNKYLTDRFNAAVWLIKSIEQRKQTIYNVASAVVKYQQDFFDNGEKSLKTLPLKQIAEDVELKYFFSSGVSGEDGTGVSSNSVKSIIKEIIAGENPQKPYSDQDMVEILKDKGIDISRRTVAKYREGMNILSSSKRRRF